MSKCIPLTQGKQAVVDDSDFEWLSQYKWHASLESRGTKWYACRRAKKGELFPFRSKIRMHCVVMGRGPFMLDGMVVDHVNHDSLDNRRSNLEIVTQQENMRRSDGWKKPS